MLGRIVGSAEDGGRLGRDVSLSVSRVVIARCGSDKDEFANELRTIECNLLSDHPTDREAEKINFRQSETIEERCGVLRHACKRCWHFAARTRDTRIIEDDDLTLLGKPVQNSRVPVVEVSGKVLVKDKGQIASLAPAPISEANAVGLNKLSGNCRRPERQTSVAERIFSMRANALAKIKDTEPQP